MIDASAADTWSALLRVMCRDPNDPSTVPVGFVLDEAAAPVRLASKGRHPFAVYRWVFELDKVAPQRTRVRSQTWAAFPGLHGKIYRALVIGSGGHRVVVRWTLKRIAAEADTEADYTDTFEAPILVGDPRAALSTVVRWIHRHVLRFDGWTVVRSDPDEIVLAADGPLMRASLTLWRHDGRASLTTRLHYRRKFTARMVWAAVGPVHRVVAPRMLASASVGYPISVRNPLSDNSSHAPTVRP
nr:DUF2867 domain-containing protein [Mycobacterium sp. MFM001]